MPIKKILVPVMGLPADRPALELAFRTAKQIDAHVTAIYAAYDALHAAAYVDDSAPPQPGEELAVLAKPETRTSLREARAAFDAVKAKWQAPPRARPAQGIGFSADYVIAAGRVDDMVAEQGRVSDLIVLTLPTAQQEAMLSTVVHAAIMETNRPVLLSPQSTQDGPFRRIAVAWNGSASAAQALSHALPLLASAELVTVLAVQNPAFSGPPAVQVADYIAWHGVQARAVQVDVGDKPIGIALVEAAGKVEADLLVMGAYSQGRVRRMIAGGVTRAVMERTGLPVFMAH